MEQRKKRKTATNLKPLKIPFITGGSYGGTNWWNTMSQVREKERYGAKITKKNERLKN